MNLSIDCYLGGLPVHDLRVLAVEDEAIHSEILGKMLAVLGFKDVVHAPNGKVALEMLRNSDQRVHLILADIDMPEQDGLAMLRELRAIHDPLISQIPAIVLTCHRETQHVLAAKKAGASYFIGKPFEITTLREKIIHLFTERRSAVMWDSNIQTAQNAAK